MRYARRSPVAGFTLLEGVVALTILSAVSVAALGALSANLRSTERASRALTGAALAEDRLVALRLLPGAELMPLADSLRDGRFSGDLTGYTWSAEVRPSIHDPTLLRATVAVRWNGGSESLETLLPRGGR